MQTIGAYEAKVHLSQLLDKVANGKTITITRHGVPVAVLIPPPTQEQPDVGSVIEALRQFRQGVKPLAGLSVRAMIEDGRRF